MFKSSDVVYWKPYNFNIISLISGVGYYLRFNYLYRFLKSLRKCTQFDLGLVCAKDGYPHSKLFSTSRDLSYTKHSTSFFDIYLCNFGTGYGREHIGFAYYFNSESTGSILQVLSVPSNNYLNFCNYFRNKLHCVVVIRWHGVSITLCKYAFSYLASNISRNFSVVVRTCYDSYKYLK